jgi:hypothetical protein
MSESVIDEAPSPQPVDELGPVDRDGPCGFARAGGTSPSP